MRKVNGIFVMDPSSYEMVYSRSVAAAIAEHVDLVAPVHSAESIRATPEVLRDVQVLFSGWGGPRLDETFCNWAPRLRAVFYAAGSLSGIVTPAVWKREIAVTSAYAANAVPVAEYALATILFSLKHGWSLSRQTVSERRFPSRDGAPGCYGSVVGLVSMGMIARTLLKLLAPFDLKVIAYDPFLTHREAVEMGIELVSLEEVFRRSQVVSVHTPHFPETEGLITGEHLSSMPPGATFINTARGQIVNEPEMIEVLRRRPDLHAVLDVTQEEPPASESPLYTLPNVTLTPHIAGSVGTECQRMGQYMVSELKRYIGGRPMQWLVTPELAFQSSHRPVGMTSAAGIKVKVASLEPVHAPLVSVNSFEGRSATSA